MEISVGSQYDRKLLCDCNTSWEILLALLSVFVHPSIHSVTDVSRHWINYCASKFFFLTSVFKTRLWISWWLMYDLNTYAKVSCFIQSYAVSGTCEDAPCLYADESSDCWIGQDQLHYRLTVWDTPHLETTGHHHISGVSHVVQLRSAVNSHMCGTK